MFVPKLTQEWSTLKVLRFELGVEMVRSGWVRISKMKKGRKAQYGHGLRLVDFLPLDVMSY